MLHIWKNINFRYFINYILKKCINENGICFNTKQNIDSMNCYYICISVLQIWWKVLKANENYAKKCKNFLKIVWIAICKVSQTNKYL